MTSTKEAVFPMEVYLEKCEEVGLPPDVERFNKVHSMGRSFIKAAMEREAKDIVGEDSFPYFVMDINDNLYYFCRVGGTAKVYFNVLTKEEVELLKY